MSIDTTHDEALADLETLCRAISAGAPRDPELIRRVEERAKLVQDEIRRRGIPTDSVALIRSGRDDE